MEQALGLGKYAQSRASTRSSKGAAVSYLRVSTQRQTETATDIDKDGNSIATQRDLTRNLAKELGVPILKEFVDPGKSAKSIENRPEFKELLEFVRENREIKYVLVYMRHRAFRNSLEATLTKHMLKGMGVKIRSVKDDFGEGPDAEAMEGMTDIFNELQVKKGGHDIRDKLLHKVQRGGTVGRARIGYLNTRKEIDGHLVNTIDVDPIRGPLVRWGFQAYATGEFSIMQLVEELELQGLTTRPTKRWAEKAVSDSQLGEILRDPYYAGFIRYKGELYKGRHESLVSPDLFLTVQSVLEIRARRTQRDRIFSHYLRGMLACQKCHDRGYSRRLVYAEAKGNGGTYEYFLCTGRMDIGCTLGSLPVQDVEAAIAEHMASYSLSTEISTELRAAFKVILEESEDARKAQSASYRKQLKSLAVREENLLNLAADGAFDSTRLRAKLKDLALEQAAIQDRLSTTDESIERGVATGLLYTALLESPGEFYCNAPDTERRRILDAFFSDIRIGREDVSGDALAEGVPHPSASLIAQFGTVAPEPKSHPRQKAGDDSQGDDTATSTLYSITTGCLGLHKTILVGPTGIEPMTSTV
ncbi:recombinase family protein [Arthrobacter sp. CJ23]|uniref:recombinase family protein n=1 Tax=Arthrobacter sp. CJ23 TaxID=2972479 RepID=UPI0037BFA4E3